MNDLTHDIDSALEEVLMRRATRASVPAGLRDAILSEIGSDPGRRPAIGPGGLAGISLPALAWTGLAAAALALAVVWATSITSRSALTGAVPSAAYASPAAPGTAASSPVYCTQARSLPGTPSGIDLTGTWSDREFLYYLRQSGDEVWGVAPYPLAGPAEIPLTGSFLRVIHGTVGPGAVVTLDWAEVGAVSPTDTSYPKRSGSMTLRAETTPDGGTRLTVTAQTGDVLTGPAYSPLVLTPCTPSTSH